MAQSDRSASPAWVRDLRARVEKWRRSKQAGSRMPTPLWDEAARLARTHGVNPVAQALRLDYYSLKRRMVGCEKTPAVKAERSSGFVELDLSEALGAGGCVVVLEHPSGAKMTLRLPRSEGVDLAGLTNSFWSQGK